MNSLEMKLQLAIDLLDVQGVQTLLEEVIDLIDIVEIGTPLILQEGMAFVRKIKASYPAATLLADLKIVDAGELEAQIGFDAGADIVTVLGLADDVTIQGALDAARKRGKQIMVDLISVKDVQKRVRELEMLGVDHVCVHTAFDVQSQGRNPLEELRLVEMVRNKAQIAVAGGIKPETLRKALSYHPDIVVVGSFVTGHPEKRQATLEIKRLLESTIEPDGKTQKQAL
jgi:3-hexulose-6-phosphate synthase